MFLKTKKTAVVTIIVLISFLTACEYEKLQPYGVGCDSEVSYKNDIVPILNKCCVSCHFAGATSPDLTSWTGLQSAANNGTLNNRVIVLKDMPPTGMPAPTEEERAKISCWIKQGALNN